MLSSAPGARCNAEISPANGCKTPLTEAASLTTVVLTFLEQVLLAWIRAALVGAGGRGRVHSLKEESHSKDHVREVKYTVVVEVSGVGAAR